MDSGAWFGVGFGVGFGVAALIAAFLVYHMLKTRKVRASACSLARSTGPRSQQPAWRSEHPHRTGGDRWRICARGTAPGERGGVPEVPARACQAQTANRWELAGPASRTGAAPGAAPGTAAAASQWQQGAPRTTAGSAIMQQPGALQASLAKSTAAAPRPYGRADGSSDLHPMGDNSKQQRSSAAAALPFASPSSVRVDVGGPGGPATGAAVVGLAAPAAAATAAAGPAAHKRGVSTASVYDTDNLDDDWTALLQASRGSGSSCSSSSLDLQAGVRLIAVLLPALADRCHRAWTSAWRPWARSP